MARMSRMLLKFVFPSRSFGMTCRAVRTGRGWLSWHANSGTHRMILRRHQQLEC